MEFSNSPITFIIMGITIATSLLAESNPAIKEKLMFTPYLVKREKDYLRFISGGLIHGGFFHLFINMFVLYFFGTAIEMTFGLIWGAQGSLMYVVLYLLGLIASGLPSYFKHQDHSYYRALGASGAVSSVMYAYILFYPMEYIYLYGIIGMPSVLFGILYLIYEFYAGKKQFQDGIGHDAHFWGAVFGFVFPLIFRPGLIGLFIEEITDAFAL